MSAYLDDETDMAQGRLDRDVFIEDYEKTKRYQPNPNQPMWYQSKPEKTVIRPSDEKGVVWTCP